MKKNEESGNGFLKYFTAALTGGFVALALCVLLLLAASVAMLSGVLPENATGALTIALAAVSSVVGGFVAAKRAGGKFLIVGLIASLVFFVLVIVIGLIFYDSFLPQKGGLGTFLSMLGGNAVGSILGGNTGKKRRN